MYKNRYIGLVMCYFAMAMADPVTFSVGDLAKYTGSAVSLARDSKWPSMHLSPRSRELIIISGKHPHDERQCG